MILPAARVTDQVVHSTNPTFGRAGIVIGGIVGLVAAVLAGPEIAIGAVILGTIDGAANGQSMGKAIEGVLRWYAGDDEIIEGAEHVFTNMKESAIADPKCTMKQHSSKYVITGAEHVFIEQARASRQFDYTNCPGQIVTGSNDTWIGGEITPIATSTDILDAIGSLLDVYGKFKGLQGISKTIAKGAESTALERLGAGVSAYNLATGGNTGSKATSQGIKILKWLGYK